jgi:hypothetical protein
MQNQPFILPSGISGLHTTCLPDDQGQYLELFRQACQQATHLSGRVLLNVYDLLNEVDRTYHLACIQTQEGTLLIFCNKYYPIVAVSQVTQEDAMAALPWQLPPNQFTEAPELRHFFEPSFTILSPEYLRIPVNSDIPELARAVSQLDDFEFAEFSYWEPKYISDIVFNSWPKQWWNA